MIYRLKKNLEFRFIYRRGKSYANNLLVMYVIKSNRNKDKDGTPYNKVGISVSKKVGNSVVRSRTKRLISESYRLKKDSVIQGYNIIFVARTNIKGKTFKEVESAMNNLVKKAGLINNEKNIY